MGNDNEECEFDDELSLFFNSDPKIISPATVSSLVTASTGSTSTDEDEETSLAKAVPKKKRKRRSKSSAAKVVDFLTECKEEKDARGENGCYGSIPGQSVKEGSLKYKAEKRFAAMF